PSSTSWSTPPWTSPTHSSTRGSAVADISSTRTDLPVDPVSPANTNTRRLKLPVVSGLGTWFALIWTVIIVLGALLVDFLPLSEARDPSLALMVPSMLPPDLASDFPLG